MNSEYSLEGLMLKLKLQYFGHLMQRPDSLEKTLMLGKTEKNPYIACIFFFCKVKYTSILLEMQSACKLSFVQNFAKYESSLCKTQNPVGQDLQLPQRRFCL